VSIVAVNINDGIIVSSGFCLLQGFAQEHSAQLLSDLPTRWEKLGDLALLPRTCMASPDWGNLGQSLWRAVATALGIERLAMQASVANTGHCSSMCLSHLACISSVHIKRDLCEATYMDLLFLSCFLPLMEL